MAQRVRSVNPGAKVVPCRHGKVNLGQVLKASDGEVFFFFWGVGGERKGEFLEGGGVWVVLVLCSFSHFFLDGHGFGEVTRYLGKVRGLCYVLIYYPILGVS